MQHRKRQIAAMTAGLGLVLSSLALASPANAGHQNDDVLDTTTLVGTGPQSGTMANGVEWSVDKGTGPSEQGYHVSPSMGVQTYTFSEPVSLEFGLAGLNCSGEAVRLQDGIEPVDIHPTHVWDGDTNLLSRNGSGGAETSTFRSVGPVTEFTIEAVGAPSCGRGVASFQVGYLDNQTPTASIAAPIDGGAYTQGQTVLADYTCTDGDTVHVDAVDCVGTVPAGDPVDTSTPGQHSFTVTATDEHGASSSSTVSYTVGDQAGACMAAAVNLPGNLLDLGVANRPTTPCVSGASRMMDFTGSLGMLPFPLTALSPAVYVKVAEGKTEKDGNTHRATSTVAQVRISVPLNNWSFEIKDLWSEVEASVPTTCADGAELKSHVEFGRIVRNGVHLHNAGANKTLSIPIPLLGEIALNKSVKTGNRVTTDAVLIDLPGNLLDINIGRSVAGVDC